MHPSAMISFTSLSFGFLKKLRSERQKKAPWVKKEAGTEMADLTERRVWKMLLRFVHQHGISNGHVSLCYF